MKKRQASDSQNKNCREYSPAVADFLSGRTDMGFAFLLRCDRRQNTGCVWPCAAHHFSDGSVDLWRRKRYGGAGENVRTHGMADLSAVDPSFYIWSAAGDPKRLLAVSDG